MPKGVRRGLRGVPETRPDVVRRADRASGVLPQQFVERRKWWRSIATPIWWRFANFLPGPAPARWHRHRFVQSGLLGALAAWTAFTLPSALASSCSPTAFRGRATDQSWLHGLKIADGGGRGSGHPGYGENALRRTVSVPPWRWLRRRSLSRCLRVGPDRSHRRGRRRRPGGPREAPPAEFRLNLRPAGQ